MTLAGSRDQPMGGRTSPSAGAVRRSMPLVAGLGVLAGTSYVTLVLAGRLLGAASFAGISVLYVLISSFATGLFLPVEQEIARRRGHERGSATFDPALVRRAVGVSLTTAIAICLIAVAARPVSLRLLGGQLEPAGRAMRSAAGLRVLLRVPRRFRGQQGTVALRAAASRGGRLPAGGHAVAGGHGAHSVAAVGWLFGAAPWIALAASFAGRTAHAARGDGDHCPGSARSGRPRAAADQFARRPVAGQRWPGDHSVACHARRARAGRGVPGRSRAGAHTGVPFHRRSAELPACHGHALAVDESGLVALTRRVLPLPVLTVVSTAVAAAAGPVLIRLLFGFRDGVGAVTFLAMGVSVGLCLIAMILAQALLGRGMHAWTTAGWLIGLAALLAATTLPGSAVDWATFGFWWGPPLPPAPTPYCWPPRCDGGPHPSPSQPGHPARAAVLGQSGAIAFSRCAVELFHAQSG